MLASGTEIGRYRVKRKLAEGGMAEIFLAAAVGPEGFEKEVVIKRIRNFLAKDQTFIEMFKAEARLASRLNHANIVQIFDFAMHEDTYFIAMEFVHGGSLWDLRRRCREQGVPMPPALVAEVGAQVARGLHYAHQLTEKGKPVGLVHRDVTPHNVLLGYDGAVKLTDFGIAKAGTSFTAPGMLKGKFAYMSPEQARGEPVDARTDVFALGVVLWELLTGGRLFEGDSDVAVLRAVQSSEIPPPSRLNPLVPEALSQVVMKALARPSNERYPSAQELERALAAVALQHAKSAEEVNVGGFVRQMFKDELEAEQEEEAVKKGTQSKTPVGPDPALTGGTLYRDRSGEHAQRQGATPLLAEEKPRTDLMPGVRPSQRKLPTFESPDDASAARTDQMDPVPDRPKTALQPKRPSSKRLEPPQKPDLQPTPSTDVGSGAETLPPLPGAATLPPVSSGSGTQTPVSVSESTTAPSEDPRPAKSMLPWVVAALASLGLLVGLGAAAYFGGGSSQGVSTVQEVPVAPPKPVVVAPPEVKPPAEPAKTAEVKPPEPRPEEKPEPPKAVEPKPEAVAAPKEPEVKRPARAMGVVVVHATPYASLKIDGVAKDAAQGGYVRYPVPAGKHTLLLEHPKKRVEKKIEVRPGEEFLIEFNALKGDD